MQSIEQHLVRLGLAIVVAILAALVPASSAMASQQIYYLHGDHLGTPRAATNTANQVVWRNLPTGEPFGASAPEQDPDGDSQITVINLRFPGQYFDSETNFSYNYFRDYDSSTGRYVQSDPIGLEGGSMSLYTYADNAPTMKTDPLGLQAIPMPPPAIPGFSLPGSHPKPNDLDNLLELPSSKSPSFSWPSWLTPKSAAERCEEKCDEEYDNDQKLCEAWWKTTGRKPDAYRLCMNRARESYIKCYQDCKNDCKN